MKKDYQFYIVTAVAAVAVIFLLSYANIALPSVGQAFKMGTSTGGLSITCTDSDNGADPTVLGQTKGKQKDTLTFVSVVDYCYDDSTLVEYTCENNYIATSKIDCNCEEGICAAVAKSEVKKTLPEMVTIQKKATMTAKTQDCIDSDDIENVYNMGGEGVTYYTQGTVTITSYSDGTSESWGDSCYSNGVTLAEWYCDEKDEKQQKIYSCPNGCSDGACL